MPVTDAQQDFQNLTLTIIADFAVPVERIWQVYADPRQLEKVWGPPTYPATVVDHDLTPGQMRNLERATSAEVLDRSMVILSIFQRHARTREARMQVEIAQLAYMAPRLREAHAGGR